jgi:uncharacterized integral membrane protein
MIEFLFLCFPAYVAAQIVAFWRLRRTWLWIALVPAVVMALVVAATAVAYFQGSPQWPLLLLFFSPAALLWLIALLALHAVVHSKNETRQF